MNRVIWTEPALDNLAAIAAYIEQFNPRVAKAVAAELIAAGNSLVTFRIVDGWCRVLSCGSW